MVEFFYYVRSVEMKKPNKLGKVKKGISDLLVKKETYENKLIQLKNQGKKLEKMASIEERKKRTHRLIERGAILESIELFDIYIFDKAMEEYKNKKSISISMVFRDSKKTLEENTITKTMDNILKGLEKIGTIRR